MVSQRPTDLLSRRMLTMSLLFTTVSGAGPALVHIWSRLENAGACGGRGPSQARTGAANAVGQEHPQKGLGVALLPQQRWIVRAKVGADRYERGRVGSCAAASGPRALVPMMALARVGPLLNWVVRQMRTRTLRSLTNSRFQIFCFTSRFCAWA